MNLTDHVYDTVNRTFLFKAEKYFAGYTVVILRWSSLAQKHVFLDTLCQEVYTDMLGEPDQLFESLFDKEIERDLSSLLTGSGIGFVQAGFDHVDSRNGRLSSDILFVSEEDAQAAVKVMQDRFRDTTES